MIVNYYCSLCFLATNVPFLDLQTCLDVCDLLTFFKVLNAISTSAGSFFLFWIF